MDLKIWVISLDAEHLSYFVDTIIVIASTAEEAIQYARAEVGDQADRYTYNASPCPIEPGVVDRTSYYE